MKTACLNGFGNEHESEALPDALPRGRFSPQRPAYGLYAEQLSTTAFTVPRPTNRRTWFYRIRPSVLQGSYAPITHELLQTAPLPARNPPPDPMRWDPLEVPEEPADFIDGLVTLAVNGDCAGRTGIGVHVYLANRSMADRYFCNADGELLLVPQLGELILHTECGVLEVAPGVIAVLPRGMKFRIEVGAEQARGYVCENYGAPFELPEPRPRGRQRLRQRPRLPVPGGGVRGPGGIVRTRHQVRGQPVRHRTRPLTPRCGGLDRQLRPLPLRTWPVST